MPEKLKIIIFLLMCNFSSRAVYAQNTGFEKKIIEFGWDYPGVSFLKNHIVDMEKKPFDGVVFSFDFDIYNAFDTTQRPDSVFQYNDLAGIKWKKFTDNFLFVRGVSVSGAHWLDDQSWIKISNNLKKVSKALSVANAKGIGFDPEYYYSDSTLNPWLYQPSFYHGLKYEQVGAFVRKRGKQFIRSLQSNKPDVKILFFWLLDLFDAQSRSQPASETGMALYPFFIEGIMDGINNISSIIDGNESSYWFQNPENFIRSGEYLRARGSKIVTGALQSKFRKVTIAQSVYFDWIFAKIPAYEKGYNRATKERYLRNNLYFALKSSDKYVWFYNERINWWKEEIDPGVVDALRGVRKQINSKVSKSDTTIKGTSLAFNFMENNSHKTNGVFYFEYSKKKNTIDIQLLHSDVINLQVYENSRLVKEVKNPKAKTTINLNKKYYGAGNLIVMSIDASGKLSIAYLN
jgi:hypothetical protein